MHLFTILTILAGAAVAAPSPPKCKAPAHFNAGFDDITAKPGLGAVNKLPSPYKGLVYSGFAPQSYSGAVGGLPVDTPPVGGVPIKTPPIGGLPVRSAPLVGLPPNSSPNTLTWSILTQVGGQHSAKINVPSAGARAMNLKSLFFGCSANVAGLVNQGIACSVLATGRKRDGTYISTSFSYDGTGGVLKRIVFPKTFNGIIEVNFAFTGDVVQSNAATANFDNVVYDLLYC